MKDKANVVPPSAGKEKGEGKEKKAKNPLSPVLEKKTKLKRRDDIEPPNYIGTSKAKMHSKMWYTD